MQAGRHAGHHGVGVGRRGGGGVGGDAGGAGGRGVGGVGGVGGGDARWGYARRRRGGGRGGV